MSQRVYLAKLRLKIYKTYVYSNSILSVFDKLYSGLSHLDSVDSMERENTFKERATRSLVKAISYRIIVITLDFTVIYLLTRRYDIALGFMVISNIYTAVAYYLHERVWNRIRWGKNVTPGNSTNI